MGGGFGATGITCALREERERYSLRVMRTRTAQDYVNYANPCGAPALCQEGRGHAYLTRAGGMLV